MARVAETTVEQTSEQTAPARTPVTETGVALLARIKSSPAGYMMLTQAEGAAIVAAGQATVNTDGAQADGTAPVYLTPVG